MERVRRLLTDLFRRVISEHGREAPGLTDVRITRADGRFAPRVVAHFSNGHSASTPARADDFYAFCQRHSVWDRDRLGSALFDVARSTYAEMVEYRMTETNAGERHRLFSRHPWADMFRHWDRSSPDDGREAHARGLRLLDDNLSPAQREQYAKCGYFDVIGGQTGRRYRVMYGCQMNIEQLDSKGRPVSLLCFVPEGDLVVGDVMLAQKLALELFELQALKVANTFSTRHYSLFGPLS